MFWHAASYSQPSPIESILEKESFTLEELLDEDDLIQETKSLNGRLIDFLKQPNTVLQLISLIVEPAQQGLSRNQGNQASPEAKRALKYPYVACEVFCCEAESILSTLIEDEKLMGKLFSLLDHPRPLDCVLAGYFARVVHFLFLRKWGDERDNAGEVMQFLQQRPEILDKMVLHIETTSIAEVLLRFLGADEFDAGDLSPSKFSWMTSHPVLERLLDQLDPAATLDSQQNAAHVLSGVARSHFTPLAQSLAAPQFLSQLLEKAFAPNVCGLALDICIALLERKSVLAEQQQNGPSQTPPDSPSLNFQTELDTQMRATTVQEILPHLGRLREILESSSAANVQMLTPFGMLAPPLGMTRLKAVEVVAALAFTGLQQADTGLIEHGLLKISLDLFLRFPFNNLLHHIVTSIICFTLEHGSTEILTHLLEECKLVPWLVTASETVEPAQPDATGASKSIRAGYLGHLTHVANRLAEAATIRDAVAVALGSCPTWGDWVDNTLRTRNDTENVLMWTCGRPSKRDVTASVSSVDELDNDSLVLQDVEELPGQAGASGRYSKFQDDLGDSFEDHMFSKPKGFGQANDTAAAFRNTRFGNNMSLDDSSSSSSDDDDVTPLRNRILTMGMDADDDDVVVTSHSDDEDDEKTAVLSGAQVHPTDVGFTDFSDFGGFQPSDEVAGSPPGSSPGSAAEGTQRDGSDSETGSCSEPGTPEQQRWNSFADPTHAGWAAFQSGGKQVAEPGKTPRPTTPDSSWDAFGIQPNAATAPEKESPPELAEKIKQRAQYDDEFSSFNYWKQPVQDLPEETG